MRLVRNTYQYFSGPLRTSDAVHTEETHGKSFDLPVARNTGLFPNKVFWEGCCHCKLHMAFPIHVPFMETIKKI